MDGRPGDPDHVDDRRAAVGLEPLADYLTRFGDAHPNTVPCQACGTPIEIWMPDPGEQIQLGCPNCGWSATFSIDVK